MAAVTRDEANALRDAPDREAAEQSDYAAPIGGLEPRPPAVQVRRQRAPDPRLDRVRRPVPRQRSTGPVPQVRLRDGIVTVQYKGRWQWDWRDRQADVALNASVPWDIEVIGGSNKLQGKLASVELRSFEMTGGVDQLRLDAGSADGHRPDPPRRRREQRPVRAAGRRARPAEAVGRHPWRSSSTARSWA